MTTQYKLIPEQLTDEMVNAAYHIWKHKAHPSILSAIRSMLKAAIQAAPELEQVELKREPLSDDEIKKCYEQSGNYQPYPDPLDNETILGIAATIPNLSGDNNALIDFAKKLGV